MSAVRTDSSGLMPLKTMHDSQEFSSVGELEKARITVAVSQIF